MQALQSGVVRLAPGLAPGLARCLPLACPTPWTSFSAARAGQPTQQRGHRCAPLCAAAAHPPPPPPAEAPPKKRLAVFVSGGGSNFKAIHAAIQQGEVHGEVVAVVSNAPSCGGAEYARAHGIPTLTYPAPKADPAAGLTADQLVQQLTQVRGGPPGGLCLCT